MIDVHAHILPGIDDGAKTFEDSINIIKELMRQGVTDIIATPHYVNESIYMSPRLENVRILNELKDRLALENIKINLFLGNEIYIDREMIDLIKRGKISTMAGSKYLLVELPLDEKWPNYDDFLRELMDYGYKVILAHPERYTIIQEDYEVAKNLFDMGVLLQCNMGSVVGKYGREAKKLVRRMAKDKMIFTFGSDIHHCSRSDYLVLAKRKLNKYYSDGELKQLLVTNPNKILNNR